MSLSTLLAFGQKTRPGDPYLQKLAKEAAKGRKRGVKEAVKETVIYAVYCTVLALWPKHQAPTVCAGHFSLNRTKTQELFYCIFTQFYALLRVLRTSGGERLKRPVN